MGLMVLGLPLAAMIVTTPIIVRGLGPQGYGLYALFSTLIAYAVLPAGARTITRFSGSGADGIAAALPELARIIVPVTLAAIVLNIAVFIAAERLFGVLPNDVTTTQRLVLVAILAAALTILAATQLLTGVMQNAGWWTTAAMLLVMTGILYQVLAAAAVTVSGDWLVVISAGVAVSGTGALGLVLMTWRRLRSLPRRVPPTEHAGITGFILSASVPTAIGHGMTIAERFILSNAAGIEAVGYYALAMTLAGLIHAVVYHGSAILGIAIKDAHRRGSMIDVRAIYQRALRWTSGVVVLGVLSLSLLGPRFVTLWLGPEISQHVASHLPWLAAAMGVFGLLVVPWAVTEMVGSPALNIAFIGSAALIFLVSAPILIQMRGVDGMAIARLLSTIPAVAYLAVVEWRSLGRIDARFWALCTVRLGLAAALTSLAMGLFPGASLLSLLAAGAAGVLVFAGSLLLTGHIKLREGM